MNGFTGLENLAQINPQAMDMLSQLGIGGSGNKSGMPASLLNAGREPNKGNLPSLGSLGESLQIDSRLARNQMIQRSHFTLQAESTRYMETETGFAYKHSSVSIEILHEKMEMGDAQAIAEDRLREMFSPEKTSERIFNMATSFFPLYAEQHGLDDSNESKQAYVDFISPYIDKGYEEAMDILGELPEDISTELQETMNLVHEKLSGFATGTIDGYHDKIYEALGEDFNLLDEDGDGSLSIAESGLDEAKFNRINENTNDGITLRELADHISKLDISKSLDQSLLDNALKTTDEEMAARAKSHLGDHNRISMETLKINIVVSETIVQYSENPDEDFPKFGKFLDENEDAQEEINNNPKSIHDFLKDFKLGAVLERLRNVRGLDESFFNEHLDKLDFMFDNPGMAKFFEENPSSAQSFAA